MPKDNIIQFPTKHKVSKKTKLEVYNARLAELSIENEYLNSDLDFLSTTLDTNLEECELLLKKIQEIHEVALKEQVAELKNEFGVDITKLVDGILHDPEKPEEKE
jgi:hypothetical protein